MGEVLRLREYHAGSKSTGRGAARAGAPTGVPKSGRDLSRTEMWAGIVAASETVMMVVSTPVRV